MVDIGKQVTYWRSGAEEDWSVGRDLVSRGHIRHGLLAEANGFNIAGRYPPLLVPAPSIAEANQYLVRMEEVLRCLTLQF